MKKEIPSPYADQRCFFCGEHNDAGLHLRFYLDEDAQVISTEYTAPAAFRGQGDILHGGFQCGLLDEVMGWTSRVLIGQAGVTSNLTVRFLKPVHVGVRLSVSCRITGRHGAEVRLEARIEAPRGTICAEASGTYRLLRQSRFDALTQRPGDG